jgi:hypothetical protein
MQYSEAKFKITIPLSKERADYRERKGKLFETLVEKFLRY